MAASSAPAPMSALADLAAAARAGDDEAFEA